MVPRLLMRHGAESLPTIHAEMQKINATIPSARTGVQLGCMRTGITVDDADLYESYISRPFEPHRFYTP